MARQSEVAAQVAVNKDFMVMYSKKTERKDGRVVEADTNNSIAAD
jgi:hypothetical protein